MEGEAPFRGTLDEQRRASTPPEPPVSLSAPHRRIARSCLTCHRRKIRCDKRSPCSNCVRNNIACYYPEVEQHHRRAPRTTIGEICSRVARLERTVAAFTHGAATRDLDHRDASEINTARTENSVSECTSPESSPQEMLVQDGDTSRYINESILSRILDKEREFQLVMTGPSVNSTRAGEARSSDLRGIFHGFNQSMTDVQSCHPSRWQALQLWQTFLNNVDPIIKILHVPTVQVTICTAINNPGDAENDLHALLFTIYFAATTSLSTVDAVNLFGQDRGTTLARFKQGLEHSLAGANIFDSPSMRSLQAMTIYITSLRAFHTGRSSWTLAGLALRMAQSIGLHRDGSNLRLSPFESEMRRRVWWYLCAADSRAAEDLGIAVSSVDRSCDTHLPVNVNDSELSPDMQGPPAPKPMWAEMTFSLITIEIGQIIQQITGRPVASAGSIHGESAGAQILKDMRTRLEDRYLRHLNPNIPIQRAISLLTPIILAKLEFVVQQQSTKRRHVKKGAFDANEDTLTVACRLLEMYLQLQTDELLRGFHWYLRSYTQYHLLTYVLWHLCLKPDGPSTERAWNALERSFQLAEPHARVTEPGSKWTVLQLLRGKALRIRETYNATKPDENNDRALEEGFGMAHAASELGDPADIRLSGDWNWGMPDYVDFQDWSNIVEEFDMQGFNGL